jgi:hypothetical protein
MEITEFSLRLKKIIRDYIEVSLNVPVLSLNNGFLDGFLDTYHTAFGFSDYGRSERPLHEFLYEVRRDGKTVIKGKTGTEFGDVRISVKKPLVSKDVFHISIRGDLEFPTGDAERGYGNGSMDAGVSVLLDLGINDTVMTFWNAGVVFPGDMKGLERVDMQNYFYGIASIEAALGKKFSLIAQLQAQTDIYPETGVTAVDRAAVLFAGGGRYTMSNGSLDLSLTEDLSTSGAPDFIVNVTYTIKY